MGCDCDCVWRAGFRTTDKRGLVVVKLREMCCANCCWVFLDANHNTVGKLRVVETEKLDANVASPSPVTKEWAAPVFTHIGSVH